MNGGKKRKNVCSILHMYGLYPKVYDAYECRVLGNLSIMSSTLLVSLPKSKAIKIEEFLEQTKVSARKLLVNYLRTYLMYVCIVCPYTCVDFVQYVLKAFTYLHL